MVKSKKQREKDYEEKQQINIFLSDDLISMLEKRAKKNMMSLPDQIEDILRRSTINQGKTSSIYDSKIDDKLISLFSRRRGGRERKG